MHPQQPEQQPSQGYQPPGLPEFYQQPPAYLPPPAPPQAYQPEPAHYVPVYAAQPAPLPQPVRSVTKQRKDTSHTFHLLMTLFTCGMWLFVWIPIIIWHKMGPRRKAVTRHY